MNVLFDLRWMAIGSWRWSSWLTVGNVVSWFGKKVVMVYCRETSEELNDRAGQVR